MLEGAPPRLRVSHLWLPVMLPARATRFRVADPQLAETLRDAGAELVETSPDVELAPPSDVRTDAPVVIHNFDGGIGEGGSFVRRAAARAAVFASLQARAALAQRRLGSRTPKRTYAWDVDRPFPLPGATGAKPERLAERLPRYALVVAGDTGRTLLEQVVVDASLASGSRLTLDRAPFVARVIVVFGEDAVLRVAVGPARRQIETQVAALDALRSSGVPPLIDELVAWTRASGRTGLAVWAVEQRIRGAKARFPLSRPLLDQCLDFLAALFSCAPAAGDNAVQSVVRDAETVAPFCGDLGPRILELAREAEETLESAPRGFGHGDFWAGNLLTDGDRLTGVIDWDAAAPGRLPLLDLFHLELSAERVLRPEEWGPAVANLLFPAARAGGSELARDLCRRIGWDPTPEQLEALVLAYWLDRVAYQVNIYGELADSTHWIERTVLDVARSVAGSELAVTRCTDLADAPGWSALAERTRNIFATPEWVDTWWRHYGRGRELRCNELRDRDGGVVGVLPLYLWQSRPLRVVRFAGHGPADRLGPLCAPEDRPRVARAVSQAVRELRADVLVAENVPGDEQWRELLDGQLLTATGSPVLSFDGRSWDDVLAAQSSNFRQQVRRRERKLFRELDAAYRFSDGRRDVQADLDTLFRLHRKRWEGNSAFLEDEPFHREFAARAAERGWARFWFLDVGGETVAAWYGFRFGGVEMYYQAGRDPSLDQYSIGFVLLTHTIRAALEEGADAYWFLRGAENYKYRFTEVDPGLETFGVACGPAGAAAVSVLRVRGPLKRASVYVRRAAATRATSSSRNS